jgi:hypothetical protein
LAEITTVVGRAKGGDASVLPRLRELLEDHPALWGHYGDLSAQAEAAWANLAAGQDLYLRESLLRQGEALRHELAGPHPTPAERLLAARVVACWVQMAYHDAVAAQSLGSDDKPRLMAFRAQRQEQAQRQYLAALAAFMTLRKLLPGTTPKVRPAEAHDPAHAERNGHARNGHAADLPPGIQNRLAGIFGEGHDTRNEGHRVEETCPVLAGD